MRGGEVKGKLKAKLDRNRATLIVRTLNGSLLILGPTCHTTPELGFGL